jgi:uncharacterized protein
MKKLYSRGLLHSLWFFFGVLTWWTLKAQNIPAFTGTRVRDAAGILSAETRRYLEQLLKEHEDSTSNQVMVLTVPSLDGYDIETYANKAFRTYRLGQEDKNNGVLLLIAVQDRLVRIETGYGLEGALPDALAGRIIDHEILPAFRNGDYDAGVLNGIHAILQAIKGEYEATDTPSRSVNIWVTLAVVIILILIVASLSGSSGSNTRGGGWWLPGGGYRYMGGGRSWGGVSGGGFSGGGGSSGGGGASGRW